MCFTLSMSLSVALAAFLIMHTSLILIGCTTLEFNMFGFRSPYSFGLRQNVIDIFGPTWSICFLPISPPVLTHDVGTHHTLPDSIWRVRHLAGRAGPTRSTPAAGAVRSDRWEPVPSSLRDAGGGSDASGGRRRRGHPTDSTETGGDGRAGGGGTRPWRPFFVPKVIAHAATVGVASATNMAVANMGALEAQPASALETIGSWLEADIAPHHGNGDLESPSDIEE